MKVLEENSLLRLPQVLKFIPVSRSGWWAGVKAGRFPKPVKLGPHTSAWVYKDILAVLKSFSEQNEEKTE